MSTPMDTAIEAWGAPLPDWLEVLAHKCAETSQRKAAKEIGYSAAMVSQLLRKRYSGNVAAVEEAVRGAWMGATVACPVLGDVPTTTCLSWQRKAREFVPSTSHRVRMYRACNACPRHTEGK